ncbi:MAG TPA: hypothetical protein PLJ98_06670 [Acholeplasmataceae bacterium]|nr:hypothetical protein [Acholeplasmataceae bacterium]
MKPIYALIVYILIPTIIGLTLYLFTQIPSYIELSYFVFAVIQMMLILGRANRNDRLNMQEYGTTKIDRSLDSFKDFKKTQYIIMIAAVVNLLLAFISFYIFGV